MRPRGDVLFDVRVDARLRPALAAARSTSMHRRRPRRGRAHKRNPADFVLWKPSAAASRLGLARGAGGRPGWHIECSAMAARYLGQVFDIHGGGLDLIFPHHENEIAQSRCAHGTDVMANYWLHNGFLQVEGEKMSRALGNFVTIRDARSSDWPGEVVRLAMLMTHYRAADRLDAARLARGPRDACEVDDPRAILPTRDRVHRRSVVDALNDDLNTPRAIAQIQVSPFTSGRRRRDRAVQERAEAQDCTAR